MIFSNKAGNNIKCLMPWNMCWDPVSNVAEVWCCSEHYLWLFDGNLYLDPFVAVYCYCTVVSEDAKTTWASGLQTLSLGGGCGHTRSQLWIKLTLEYPFKLKLQAAINGHSQSTHVGACCRWGVPRRHIQGKTLYMFEQFGVNGKLYVEVIMTWWFYGEASKWTAPPRPPGVKAFDKFFSTAATCKEWTFWISAIEFLLGLSEWHDTHITTSSWATKALWKKQ